MQKEELSNNNELVHDMNQLIDPTDTNLLTHMETAYAPHDTNRQLTHMQTACDHHAYIHHLIWESILEPD
jgi:hypothetical protein